MPLSEAQTKKKPLWLKVRFPSHQNFFQVSHLVKEKNLHTICQSAKCPNIGECWSQRTAAFLILGDTCTRSCTFCAVEKGTASPLSSSEPQRVADAVASMGLRFAVVTSVTRDDLPDGGASVFAKTITSIKERVPGVKVEVLIPDFKGSQESLKNVIDARPDILNHNIEVPEAHYPQINRPKENYRRSLKVLEQARKMGTITKSGLMVGLGEKENDIMQTFADLREVGCELLTIGQYLQPSKRNAPVHRYYTPQEFFRLRKAALDFGFKAVESGPLVRSSYMAHKMHKIMKGMAH